MAPFPFATLITTKLHRPAVPAHFVPRPRLVRMLERGKSVPLTLVCAPAGFGKTTLVSAWIKGMTTGGIGNAAPLPAAWLSLDERDSAVDLFLCALIAAIQTQAPGACALTLDLLAAPLSLSFDTVLTTFSNELALISQPFIIVLDDYQSIGGGAVHDLLSGLLRHWPPFIHLVLISRSNPPLPLARLRASNRIVEIRSRDLRFTSEETAALLDRLLLSPPRKDVATLLDRRTEGWVAGVQMAALSLAVDGGDVETYLAGTDAGIADYLASEVLSRQPAVIQYFLLTTSLMDRFCVGLCEALVDGSMEGGSVRDCVNWLETANLFVIPLDKHGEWYRYHHLFQEFLQRRLLLEVGPERTAGLHRLAANWFAQNQLIEEALHHALLAHDHDLAARVMEGALCEALNRDDRPALERWLNLLPDEVIARRPGVLMIKAWAYQLSWRFRAQARVLEQVEALLAKDGGSTPDPGEAALLRGQLLTLYGQAAYFCNDVAGAIAMCKEAMALLPPDWMYVRGGTMIYLGLAMQAGGQAGAAENLLLDAYEALGQRATSYGLRLLVALAFVYLQEGKLEQVKQTAQLLLAQAGPGAVIPLCWAHFFLGMVHYHRNELEEAQRSFDAVVQARFMTQMLAARASFFGLVLSQHALGQIEAAQRTLELLSQFDLQTQGVEDVRTRSLRARLQLMDGDLGSAALWADALASPPPDQPLLWLEEPYLTKVRILLASGGEQDSCEALRLLDAYDELARRTHNRRFQVEILALRALALNMTGEKGDALISLEEAVYLARGGGFVRVFVELGQPVQAILERLVQRGSAAETARRILAAFADERKNPNPSTKPDSLANFAPLVERLTMREVDVLLLLRERLSNKEIAQKLSLSTTTVKRHTANIYGKLGVNRRWEAVIRAEALGLLPPR